MVKKYKCKSLATEVMFNCKTDHIFRVMQHFTYVRKAFTYSLRFLLLIVLLIRSWNSCITFSLSEFVSFTICYKKLLHLLMKLENNVNTIFLKTYIKILILKVSYFV